jgi:DNA primase
VIGFGARKMREDDAVAGKYINSPETPIYNKSRVLFGLFHSKESIRQEDSVLLVEGYADLISLYQAGVRNVVASSGTALTEDQVLLIGRYSKNLTLIYDADSAGSNATLRGIDLALERDLNVRVVELPEGDDPDSFVRKYGGKAFRELLAKAVSFIDFKANQFQRSGAFATPEGKSNAVRSVVQSIARMKDELKRNFYIKEVAEKYDIYESLLFRELERISAQEKRTPRPDTAPANGNRTRQADATSVASGENKLIPPEERDIVKLLLEGNPEIIRFVLSNISLLQMSDGRARKLAQNILDLFDERGIIDATTVIDEVPEPELKSIISDLTLSRYELSPGWQAMEKEIDEPDPMVIARDAVTALRRKAIQKEMEENQRALKEASVIHGDATPYLRKQQELLAMLKNLETLRS